jgi:hypothetical protein
MEQFLRLTWLRGLAPGLLGVRVQPDATTGQDAAVVVAQLALLVTVAGTIVRRPAALRAWVFFGLTFLLNAVLIGWARVHQFGPDIGRDPRYWSEYLFLFWIAAGLAVTVGRWARPGTDAAIDAAAPSPTALPPDTVAAVGAAATSDSVPDPGRGGVQAPPRPPQTGAFVAVLRPPRQPTWLPGAIAAAIVVSFALTTIAAGRQLDSEWDAEKARTYVDNLRRAVAELRARGENPVFLNRTVIPSVLASFLAPYNRYDKVFPTLGVQVDFSSPGDRLYATNEQGEVVPQKFVRALPPYRGVEGTRFVSSAGGEHCFTGAVRMEYVPPRPFGNPATDLLWKGTSTTAVDVPVVIDTGAGYPPYADGLLKLPKGRGSAATPLADPVVKAALDVPGGAHLCVSSIGLGAFFPR